MSFKMIKFLFATIFALFLSAISVDAASSFNILEDSVNLSGVDGALSSSFNVNNTGTTSLDIIFTLPTLTNDTHQLSLNSLANIAGLAADSIYIANFSLEVPSQQKAGFYSGLLTATSGSLTDEVTINVDVTPSYAVTTSPASTMNLGGTSLNSTHEKVFNVTNNGNEDLTNVSFDFSKTGFNLQTNNTNFVLAYNATATIEFNVTIPKDSSTGNVTVGSLTLSSTELSKTLFALTAEIGGGLIIEDLDVFLTTRDSKNEADLNVGDGKRLDFGEEDAGPGSELRFNLAIENTFSDDEDIDVDDVTVEVTIEEIDDGEDLTEESDEFDVKSGNNEEVDVYITVPISVDQDDFDVIIDVQGKDSNGNTHTAQMNLKLKIDKKSRDVIVSEATVFPEAVKCSRTITLTATIKNLGAREETEAGIEIINTDLGVNFLQHEITLEQDPFDSDNEFTKKLVIDVDDDVAAGTYTISVGSYINEDALWETRTVELLVEACSSEVVEEEPDEIDEIETLEVGGGAEEQDETTEADGIPVLESPTTTEIPLTKRPGFWIAVVVLNIVIIGGAAFFITNSKKG
jgi:hypothetical protein